MLHSERNTIHQEGFSEHVAFTKEHHTLKKGEHAAFTKKYHTPKRTATLNTKVCSWGTPRVILEFLIYMVCLGGTPRLLRTTPLE